MKAVLISIQPKWVEKIVSGQKTIEVRKTAPKLETPFKCYIYCTKHKEKLLEVLHKGDYCYGVKYDSDKPEFIKTFDDTSLIGYWGIGKVIGEFVCDYILTYEPTKAWNYGGKEIHYLNSTLDDATCLLYDEIEDYGNGKTLYGWHISDLKIYNRPKELIEFYKPCPNIDEDYRCYYCDCLADSDYGGYCTNYLTRPPQSWQYIEEN